MLETETNTFMSFYGVEIHWLTMNSPGAVVSLVTICQVVKIPLIAAKANAGSFIASLIANINSHLALSASRSKFLSTYIHTLSSQALYLPGLYFQRRERERERGKEEGGVLHNGYKGLKRSQWSWRSCKDPGEKEAGSWEECTRNVCGGDLDNELCWRPAARVTGLKGTAGRTEL